VCKRLEQRSGQFSSRRRLMECWGQALGYTAMRRPQHVRVPGSHTGGQGTPGYYAMIEDVGAAMSG